MGFSDSLRRLREAAHGQGRRGENCVVLVFDLRELLHHFDRLDHEARKEPPKLGLNQDLGDDPFCTARRL